MQQRSAKRSMVQSQLHAAGQCIERQGTDKQTASRYIAAHSDTLCGSYFTQQCRSRRIPVKKQFPLLQRSELRSLVKQPHRAAAQCQVKRSCATASSSQAVH